MKNKTRSKHVVTLYGVVVLFIIAQVIILWFVYSTNQSTLNLINKTSSEIYSKVDSNKRETQATINSLTDSLSSLSSKQTDLNKQISSIKASASADFSGVIENVLPSVVTIKTDVGQGTGFFVTDNGYIATNYHVVDGARAAVVVTSDMVQHKIKIVGYNNDMDVALLKMDGSSVKMVLGDSSDVRIGEKVVALGNPLGLSFTATEGIISAVDRNGINDLPYYFQTDVPLNPGNSGGPLINTQGEVIGINNFKAQDAEGVGFALEINRAKKVLNEISIIVRNETIV